MLSQSLGGNALTAIICAISPAAINYYQTLSTLRFATRAKVIKVKAEALYKLNNKDEVEFYKREIKRLKQEIENNNRKFLLKKVVHLVLAKQNLYPRTNTKMS